MPRVFVIAELGQAHDGSLGILHSYIDAVSQSGADAIKFQTHIAEAESSLQEPFRVNFSYEDETRFDYWKRMSFDKEQWAGIKDHCEEAGLEFMSSPFSIAAVELLESIGINRYKIGSGEINNYLMLERIAQTKKPMILSSGMSSFDELRSCIEFLKPYGNDLTVLQCTTNYPTTPANIGLNVISEIANEFENVTVGFSDHSGTIYSGMAAVALGAKMLEFHVVFDKRMFGPDTKASLTIDQAAELINGVRFIEECLDNPVDKNDTNAYSDLKRIFEKSLAVNKDLPVGHVIAQEDLESKKPHEAGITARDYKLVLGKKLNKEKAQYTFLQETDLENDQ